ncbi:hypothetical protein [Pseudomonas sp.]|uniref:hypothetical protein n=1 Tax=Pseudomonas sp. TaxID=306 RepID=UPI00326572E4
MKSEGMSIEVQLPEPGDEAFEAFVESVANAVYERVSKRLRNDEEGAIISDEPT